MVVVDIVDSIIVVDVVVVFPNSVALSERINVIFVRVELLLNGNQLKEWI